MADCVFCKIVSGEIPAEVLWKDDHAVAFRDIRPQAPVHVVFVPRRHVETFGDLTSEDQAFLVSLARGVREVSAREGVDRSGYRLISNAGRDAGQEVFHLHVHLLGGQPLGPMVSHRTGR